MIYCQEPVEVLSMDHVLDLDFDGKLHVLSGGTKVVQHTPPSKSGPGLKGKTYLTLSTCTLTDQADMPKKTFMS